MKFVFVTIKVVKCYTVSFDENFEKLDLNWWNINQKGGEKKVPELHEAVMNRFQNCGGKISVEVMKV